MLYFCNHEGTFIEKTGCMSRASPCHTPTKKGARPLLVTGPLQPNVKRRLPTLPPKGSTIGVTKLNFSVRDGKRWNLRAIITWNASARQTGKKHGMTIQKTQPLSGQPSTCITRTQKVRAISNARLWCLHLYTCILSTSWSVTALIIGYLILQMASCLDAFSTYPNQTWIPSNAPGGTTGKPEVCPTRSSRTSVRTAQISCAHDR